MESEWKTRERESHAAVSKEIRKWSVFGSIVLIVLITLAIVGCPPLKKAKMERDHAARLAESEVQAQGVKQTAEAEAERVRLESDALVNAIERVGEKLREYPEFLEWKKNNEGETLATANAFWARFMEKAVTMQSAPKPEPKPEEASE